MCTGAEYAALAAIVGGTYIQNEAASDAADRQQAAMNAALEQQDQFSQQAEKTALENAEQYRPEARAQRFDEARETAGQSLAQQLVQARETVKSPEASGGRLSRAFNATAAKSQADQLQDSVDMARAMGRVRGAGDMKTAEGYVDSDYASRLARIGAGAVGHGRAAQVGINAAGQPDYTMLALGQIGTGVGMGTLARGFNSAPSPGMTAGAAGGAAAGQAYGQAVAPGAFVWR